VNSQIAVATKKVELRPGRVFYASNAASAEGNAMDVRVWNEAAESSTVSDYVIVGGPVSAVSLFDTRLAMKVQIANVAMHIADTWRRSIFTQLDNMLNDEEWSADEPLPNQASVRTFIRLITFLRFRKRPNIGFHAGHVLASWLEPNSRVTLECRADDEVRWAYALTSSPRVETGTGLCNVRRLPISLNATSPNEWLFDVEHK
jgi:hypothetical protein